jgi:hypothetical protein
MSTRKIFGYIGFIVSFPIAFYFIKASNSVGIGMVGLDIIIISLLIMVGVTTVFYVIGRIIEKRQGKIRK